MAPRQSPPGNGQRDHVIALSNHSSTKLGQSGISLVSRPAINYCEPAWSWTPPPFRDFDLWIVLAGSGTLSIGHCQYRLKAGSCVIFQPGDAVTEATHDPSDPLVAFYCHFLPRPVGLRTRRWCKDVIHVAFEETAHLRQSAELTAEVFAEGEVGERLATTTVAQVVAHVLFRSAIPRQRDFGPARLTKLALDIRSKPGSRWEVRVMARQCALSPAHFNRRFRQMFGCSPIQYVIQQRIVRATILLHESDLSIQQIAAALGYSDVFFFHRQFRQIAGATPRAIRLRQRTTAGGVSTGTRPHPRNR